MRYYEKKYFNCRLFVDSNIYSNNHIKIFQFVFHKSYSASLFCPYYYPYYSALESHCLFV